MALLQTMRSLVNERLSAAAEEILWAVGQIVAEYEDEALYLKQEIDRQSRRLDIYRAGWYNYFYWNNIFYIIVKDNCIVCNVGLVMHNSYYPSAHN